MLGIISVIICVLILADTILNNIELHLKEN